MNRTIVTLMRQLRRLVTKTAVSAFDCANVFSTGAKAALSGARNEAQRMNHDFIGTEHLLLAIMHSESTVAVKLLTEMGISPEAVCVKVENFVGHGASAELTDAFPYTPRVKKALALAGKEAKELKHSHVGTQHLLLGLLRERDGVAGQVLKSFNLEVEAIRHQAIQAMASAPEGEWKQGDVG